MPGSTLLPFSLLTYAVMWTAFFTVVLARIPPGSPLGAGLIYLGAFSPSLVALGLTARAGEGPAFERRSTACSSRTWRGDR
jgi:hypothetical protein